MSQRPLFLLVGSALAVGLGACMLNTAGLPSDEAAGGARGVTSGEHVTGVGGAPGVTTAAETSATAQSSSGASGSASSSASSSAASSSASSSAASSSASSSAASSSASSASSSSGGVGGTCEDQYGDVMEYELCKPALGLCEFNVKFTNDKTCRAVCSKRGGECMATYDTSSSCTYVPLNKGCDITGYNDGVCLCSLGCGNGQPCAPNKTCVNGACTTP